MLFCVFCVLVVPLPPGTNLFAVNNKQIKTELLEFYDRLEKVVENNPTSVLQYRRNTNPFRVRKEMFVCNRE